MAFAINQHDFLKYSFIEQTFGLCGRRRGWDVSRDQH